MEFPFDVSKVLPLDSDGFAVLDSSSPSKYTATQSTATYSRGMPVVSQGSAKMSLVQILDNMGEASSRAQGLGQVITNYNKFMFSGDQRLYIKVEENRVCGILKVGKKNLFYTDGFGGFKEIKPLCVLDFYVHESLQRKGVGKLLFERMLLGEGVGPHNLAYDRPSSKFISFLKKHYGLSKYVPQNNNFVIFQEYWETTKKTVTEQQEKRNGFEPGSIQDYRDKKFNTNKPETQIPEKNVIENKIVSKAAPVSQGYSQSQPVPPKYSLEYMKMYPNIPKPTKQGPTYEEVEAQMKAADEAFAKEKGKIDVVNAGKGKTQIWNASYDKPQVNYSTKAPWGSYGANVDTFKSSSSAYGSYYAHSRSNSRNK